MPGAPAPEVLGPRQRSRALEAMGGQVFDVLVIGGGVTGAGTALDAATRGLSVALVEARDWAAGTSSRSSKLVHGGLRYLEHLRFGLVREALRERGLLLQTLSPHLVRPVPFLFPLTGRVWERAYVGAGVALYDVMAGAFTGGTGLPRHRHFTRRGVLRVAPGLRHDGLVGGIRYFDAQVDDARHTLELARTAARYGAQVATSARVVGLLRDGERVAGARVADLESGAHLEVRARQVVNATGVWADEIQGYAGGGRISIRASKGVHLVVPKDRIDARSGIIVRTERSVLFVIPWPSVDRQRHWIIGTTDTDWNLHRAHPAACRADIEYLLAQANAVLVRPLVEDDVVGVYAGLRPLLAGESEATSRLSREHTVGQPVPGLVTVAGGKYTTYRVMAADAVDLVARGLGRPVPPSCTDRIPLLGAVGYEALWNQRARIAGRAGISLEQAEHLLRRYGSCIHEVLSLGADRPALLQPLQGAPHYLAAEVVQAVTREGALHLDDVLTRRTRVSIEAGDRGLAAAEPVAALMGEVLGWDAGRRQREVAHYRARVAAEVESQQQPDDRTADAARMGAPDVRAVAG